MTRDLDRKSRLALPASIRTEIDFFLRIWCAQRPAVSPVAANGRFTVVMPHPERVFRSAQLSWHPREWGEDSPWMRMFRNARHWVG